MIKKTIFNRGVHCVKMFKLTRVWAVSTELTQSACKFKLDKELAISTYPTKHVKTRRCVLSCQT